MACDAVWIDEKGGVRRGERKQRNIKDIEGLIPKPEGLSTEKAELSTKN